MVEAGRRFDFKRCLGAGGFGEVYLASMTSASGVETEVAVKMLHEGLDPRSQAVQRLRDEGRLLGTLNHPSVLKVHDLVLLDGRVALVMEYVPGLDLEQCVELAQPIGLRAGLEVIGRVADALHTAYTSDGPDGQPLRLVHRDIKPPNVRIGQHGEVKVLDFGIAKAADARREAKTQTSVMIGSPWYMAPERFDGKNDGAPADVYALGCSLYEVAARGGRLFSELSSREHFLLALDPAAHDAHVREHLRPLDIPGDVRWLLDRMLAYDALERPTTHEVAEQVEDLAEAVGGETLRRWCKALAWPPLPELDGMLVGRVVTEARLSALTSSGLAGETAAPTEGGTFAMSLPPAGEVADPGSTGASLPPPPSLPAASLPTFDASELDVAERRKETEARKSAEVRRASEVLERGTPQAPRKGREVVPASSRRRSTPPPAPVANRRSGRPVPVLNHLIVPGVVATVGLSVLGLFGFFFLVCLAAGA